MGDRVTISVENGIADVKLSRPDKMNALDPAMFEGIIAAGEKLAAMEGLRVVVLSGEGRSFCAGLDLSNFAASASGDNDDNGGLGKKLADRTHGTSNRPQKVTTLWRDLKVPVIAAVHGVCYGGGLQIMSAADVKFVTPDARLSVMEMRWGLVPDMGAFPIWRDNVRDDVLRELTYTNREFNGHEAKEYGFATHVTETPYEAAMEMATIISMKHPQAIQGAKSMMNRLHDMDNDDVLMMESVEQDKVMKTPNQVEAVMAHMQKRAPNFVD